MTTSKHREPTMTHSTPAIPTVSVRFDRSQPRAQSNELGMRPMQARVYDCRGEQYLLIKSPPASGKSRALMFVALVIPRAIFAGKTRHKCDVEKLQL